MSLVRQIEIRALDSFKGGMAEFYTPQSSHETMLVQVAPHTVDDLFVHHFQTDQLLVVRGSMVLVVLQNRKYTYIPLTQHKPVAVKIPPGIPHGAINLSNKPCVLVNAVLRHGDPHDRDYCPLKQPFPFDLKAAQQALERLERSIPVQV
ncbi:MAG: dTDP-4-dehydrorhamnose 3,5-epimerase [Cyanobacteria bacterium SID2]|nr:dTDP-4-dehydrorhamnose 3,5-epimerase [Cyanobacteria bacterium SID2]MBP0006469.1 dTDP-4-dehydrorhamnose 3,5-epimerase [Cyanobacteria bacterium SBC]